MRRLICLSMLALAGSLCLAPVDGGGGASAAPQPWSLRMTESVMRRHPVLSARWEYTSGLMLTGIERVWERERDPKLLAYIKSNIDPFLDEQGGISTYNLDE